MKDFFVSFNSFDRGWANWIAWTLEDAGYSVVLQSEDFGGGFTSIIDSYIKNAKRTIVLLSPNYLSSILYPSEWIAAFSPDPRDPYDRLIPIRVRDCDPAPLIGPLIYVDLLTVNDADPARALLLSRLAGIRLKPKEEPAFPGAPPPRTYEPSPFPGADIVNIAIFYSERDELLYDSMYRHISLISKQDSNVRIKSVIIPQAERKRDNNLPLYNIDIALFMMTPDLMASDYIYTPDVAHLLERHAQGSSRVVPIIARPTDWRASPFALLQALPRDGRPITSWRDRDEAFSLVSSSLRRLIDEVRAAAARSTSQTSQSPPRLSPPAVRYTLGHVFRLSGVPTITFVRPERFYLLKLSLKQPGRGIIVQGPSGVGKTTALQMAAAPISSADASYKIEFLSVRNPAHRDRIERLPSLHHGTVVIDDFHRLSAERRHEIADYIKYLADCEPEDKKLVLLGIPRTGRALVEFSPDIATRLDVFEFGRVSDDTVSRMITLGERALNIAFERKSEIVSAAAGSLQVGQMLCYYLAALTGTEETEQNEKSIPCALEEASILVIEKLRHKFHDTISHFVRLGSKRDWTSVYLLEELGQSDDGFLPLYGITEARSELKSGIQKLLSEGCMKIFEATCPPESNYILYDEDANALITDDPQLAFYLWRTPVSQLARDAGKRSPLPRSKIFISYSHADTEWLQRMLIHLAPLERSGLIEPWSDTRIQAGGLWREETSAAIDTAKVAILLVSADFLASEFIASDELPRLLVAAEREGLRIIPVVVSPSWFPHTTELSRYQSLNSPSAPLIDMSKADQERLFQRMAEAVARLVAA